MKLRYFFERGANMSLPIDENNLRDSKTAIIYSVDDLFVYIVKITAGDKCHYISSRKNEPIQFGNLEEARLAALKEKVEKIYLALSKTYEEIDIKSCPMNKNDDRYDYLPITL